MDYDNDNALFRNQLYRVDGEQYSSLIHRSIVSITFLHYNEQIKYGSGVLISKNIILTAASNIYDRQANKEYSNFKVYVEANGEVEKYQQVLRCQWKYPSEFMKCPERQKMKYNYAVITLMQQIIFDQYLPLSLYCQICSFFSQIKEGFYLFGFPNAYENYSINQTSKIKLYQYGLAIKVTNMVIDRAQSRLIYQMSTLPGQNGCPVIVGDAIIGIHCGQVKGDSASSVGRIIDASLINKVMEWIRFSYLDYASVRYESVCVHTKPMIRQIKLVGERKKLQNVDLSKYARLQVLDLSDNSLKSIDLSNHHRLVHLDLKLNYLCQIDIKNNINLTHLNLTFNRLQKIDVIFNIKLTHLNLSLNKLQIIDLRTNINLKQLYLPYNQLSTIDVSANTNLTQIELSGNKLQTIDVRANFHLQWLHLFSNKIEKIDVCNNEKLVILNLHNNRFTLICLPFFENDSREKYSDNIHFDFSDQQSNVCLVELICNKKSARLQAHLIASKWKQDYSETKINKHKCEYRFQVQ